MLAGDFAEQYPHLFSEVIWPWEPARAIFVVLETLPPNDLIANVDIVPHTGEDWVTIQLEDGSWEIPGGTLEPGESYLDTIHRELMEEVGAQLISCQLIGAWQCFSLAEKPYRPYLPFPRYYRLALQGEIKFVTAPSNPFGGEKVISVQLASLGTIMSRFRAQNRYDLAELYQFASNFVV
ncbi:MAG TPA: NUDIX domain-containing protein [Anaerolineales bacterium]